MRPILVLVSNALRLDDHPALVAACQDGAPVIPVYILDNEAAGEWAVGAARRWWLSQSLKKFSDDLMNVGSRLIIRRGDTCGIVADFIAATGAGGLYMTRGYTPWQRALEGRLHIICSGKDIQCRRFGGNLLLEPEEIATKTGKPYEVFTPFWRQAKTLIDHSSPLPAPSNIPAPDTWPESQSLDDLDLAPKPVNWAETMAVSWLPGEAGAQAMLGSFLEEAVASYGLARDLPGVEGTSKLSPYLASGEISPRRIWHAGRRHLEARGTEADGTVSFLRELGWREFSAHLLFHFPHMPEQPLKGSFNAFPWSSGKSTDLAAWQKGQTGFPIIDAGMRQLWQTGWMHNRVRMIVASFLVKDMLWHWRDGEAWFWDTLVDADLASNAASWQWVAGCGADAAPYFRIFNPILQGEKFDKAGDYVRTYVPELARLPDAYIHKPFDAPAEILAAAGVTLGKTYPKPILDRSIARDRALAALRQTKAA